MGRKYYSCGGTEPTRRVLDAVVEGKR